MDKKVIIGMIAGAIVLMAVSAGIAWISKPDPPPEQLPPKVVKETVIKEIPVTTEVIKEVIKEVPGETKIVEKVVWKTKEVPVEKEPLTDLCKDDDQDGTINVLEEDYSILGKVDIEGYKFDSQEGRGWLAAGHVDVNIGGDWKQLFKFDELDIDESFGLVTPEFGKIKIKKHRISLGIGVDSFGQATYLLSYEKKLNLLAPRWATFTQPIIPDTIGVAGIRHFDSGALLVTMGWEF